VGHYHPLLKNESWMYSATGKLIHFNTTLAVTSWGQPPTAIGSKGDVPSANVSVQLVAAATGEDDEMTAEFFLNDVYVGSLAVPAGVGLLYGCADSCANGTAIAMRVKLDDQQADPGIQHAGCRRLAIVSELMMGLLLLPPLVRVVAISPRHPATFSALTLVGERWDNGQWSALDASGHQIGPAVGIEMRTKTDDDTAPNSRSPVGGSGLGRIFAWYYRSSTSYQIQLDYRCASIFETTM
jgi:hypothetical protein